MAYFIDTSPFFPSAFQRISVWLDVTSNFILHDILGLCDLRKDKRIDFVGGIRDLDELKLCSGLVIHKLN